MDRDARQLACWMPGLTTGLGARNFESSLCHRCSHEQNGQNLRANGPRDLSKSLGSTSIAMNM